MRRQDKAEKDAERNADDDIENEEAFVNVQRHAVYRSSSKQGCFRWWRFKQFVNNLKWKKESDQDAIDAIGNGEPAIYDVANSINSLIKCIENVFDWYGIAFTGFLPLNVIFDVSDVDDAGFEIINILNEKRTPNKTRAKTSRAKGLLLAFKGT